MKTNDVYVELTEDVQRIEVHFRYDPGDVAKIKEVKGRRWEKEPRFWTVPMDLRSARSLREIFGERMKLGPAVRVWAKEQVKMERNLRQLNAASDAKLLHTPPEILNVIAGRPIEHDLIPQGHALRRQRDPRPYQRADIKMMSMTSAGNFNDVGTGKTIEAIGAIYEAELNHLPVLIVAPRRSLINVWKKEFRIWSDMPCFTSESPDVRKHEMNNFVELWRHDDLKGEAIALIADDLRVEKYYDVKTPQPTEQDPLHACRDYKGNWFRFKSEAQRDFFQVEWGAFIIDEFHQFGLPNRNSLFSIGASLIKAQRKWPMSGTPIGGKPRRLWPVLNFMHPRQYSSEWNWIYDWLEVQKNEVRVRGGAKRMTYDVGGIKEGMEEAFWDAHRIHMTRRTKKDALPGLPDAVEILVDTPMEGKQLNDYIKFDEEHELMLDDKRLTGSIVLAQYTRLRQLANSSMTHNDRAWVAKAPSCKIEHLLERLDENGIRKGTRDDPYEPGARAYIGVNDKSFLTIVMAALVKAGIDCDRLDGDTKDSQPILDKFAGPQERPYVVAMTIKTGGTALDFGRANSAHALDEAWDPDVMTQFWGRGDRGARDTPLKCYTYRTPETIQEYVAQVAGDKAINNRTVLAVAKDIERLRRSN